MTPEPTFFNIVAYTILIVSLLVILGIVVLFFRDAVQQEPRFGKALKYLAASFVFGVLFLAVQAILPWAPFYIIGMTFAGTPLLLVLFVAGSFLYESAKADAGIAIAVLSGLGGVLLGVVLLVVRAFLQ